VVAAEARVFDFVIMLLKAALAFVFGFVLEDTKVVVVVVVDSAAMEGTGISNGNLINTPCCRCLYNARSRRKVCISCRRDDTLSVTSHGCCEEEEEDEDGGDDDGDRPPFMSGVRRPTFNRVIGRKSSKSVHILSKHCLHFFLFACATPAPAAPEERPRNRFISSLNK